MHLSISVFCSGFVLCSVLSAQTALSVTGSTPVNNDNFASCSSPITVTFDRPVQAGSLAGNVNIFGRWSGVVPGQVSLNPAGTVMTFQPGRPFFVGENVTISLTRDVAAVDGNTLGGGFYASFWTRPATGTGNFTMDRLIPMRSTPSQRTITYGTHCGDIDGDGAPDLTTTNEATSDLRMMLNDGCGEAGSIVLVPGTGDPSPSESADFNRDGLLDLATGNLNGDTATVFLNDGNGGFLPPIVLQTGGRAHGMAIIDAEADGWPDLVTTNRSRVLLFRNNGNNTFTQVQSIQVGSGEDGLATADANGDGPADGFVGCYTGSQVGLLLGNGTGGLTFAGVRGCGGRPWQIVAGDVDGDGHADVATANFATNTLGIVRGNGAGGLISTTTYSTGFTPVAVDLADIDGDGDLDAVTSCYSSSRHDIFWNDGNGNYGGVQQLPTTQNGSCCTVVDFDRDGIMDLISADEGADEIRIYLQDRPALPQTQPQDCKATLRIDEWAIGGYAGRPLRPVQAGRTMFFGVTAEPNIPVAIVGGFQQSPGISFPFGLANLVSPVLGIVAFGFLGDPAAITDANGELQVPFAVPAGISGSLYFQAVVEDLPGAGLLFSNPVGAVFVP